METHFPARGNGAVKPALHILSVQLVEGDEKKRGRKERERGWKGKGGAKGGC